MFMGIMGLFIVSYGVASRALRFPRSQWSWHLLMNVIYMPYWQVYGELNLSGVEGENHCCVFMLSVYLASESHTQLKVKDTMLAVGSEKDMRFF